MHALRGADFTLLPGEVHALLGENGAGKTTLMQIAAGLLQPDAGVVVLGDVPRPRLSPRKARGLGIGKLLVDQVVRFSRDKGYRRIRLWTQESLVAARRIYAGAGFKLVESKPHRSFGKDLVGEYWELEL